jgi:hypothetical protein
LVVARYSLMRPVVAATVVSCAVLLAGGAAQAAAHASASRSAATAAASSSRRQAAAQYLAIAKAGNERLEDDFDPLEGHDRNNLVAARADLRDAATTERLFDHRLLRISFPAETERVARRLYRINQARARLTVAVAGQSTTLQRLHAYERALDEANGPVEQAVATIRRQLGLPPASTS